MTAPLDRKGRAMRRGNWHIFRWPLVIGIASLAGLISALVGDGWYDAASWLLLGAILLLIARQLLRR